jgi:parallel beta-helix repeat protein
MKNRPRSYLQLLLLVSFSFCFCSATFSQNFYVNDNSTVGDVFTTAVGNDLNAGTSAAPYATLLKAITAAPAGSTIFVDAGNYTSGALSVLKALKIYGSNYNISAVTGVRNTESTIDFTSDNTGVHFAIGGTSPVEIKGFKLSDNLVFASGQRHTLELKTSNGHIVANNIFYRSTASPSGSGIETRALYLNPTTAGTTITIDNNYFTGTPNGIFSNQSWRRGIWKQAGDGTTNITNNKFENCRSQYNNDTKFINTNLSGNIFDLGNTGGTAIALGDAMAGNFVLGPNSFSGFGTPVNCSSVAAGFTLNISSSSFNGTALSSTSNDELYKLVSFNVDGTNTGKNGLVRLKAGNIYVVPATNNPLGNAAKGIIQNAITIAAAGDIINIQNGNYLNQDVNVNKAVTLNGESRDGVILQGTYAGTNAGSSATLFMSANNGAAKNITVTRDYGATLADWFLSVKNQGVLLGQNTTGIILENLQVKDQRNGIYLNNCKSFTVKNCEIHHNRTGIQMVNDNTGGKIENNSIHDNFTHGIIDIFGTATSTVLNNVSITNNSFVNNWFAHITFNAGSLFMVNGLNMNCNWFGTVAPTVNATATAEPGYAAQTPTQFGGTDPNSFNGDIRGVNAALVNYVPYLTNGNDNDVAAGFQPLPGSCNSPVTNLQLSNTTNVICYGASTGSAILSFDNGYQLSYAVNGSAYNPLAGSPLVLNNLSAGIYEVHVKDGGGNEVMLSFSITQPALPLTVLTSASGATSFCSGESVTLSSAASTGNQWFADGNPINGANNSTYIATASGSYSVVTTNANGCTATSDAIVVTVNPLPTIPVVSSNSSTTFCSGGSTVLSSSAALGNQWYIDGNPINAANISTYTATASGSYHVVTTNENGCSAISAPVVVAVNALPAIPVITASASSICTGGSATLTSTAAAGYLWSTGATTQAITVTQAGNYTVTVTNASGCSATSAVKIISVNNLPVPVITVSRTNNTYTGANTEKIIFLGYGAQSLKLTANSNAANTTYSWSPSNFLSNTSGAVTNYTPNASAAGSNTISVTATNSAGCTQTVSVVIKVIDVRCGNKNDKVSICKVKPDNSGKNGKGDKSKTDCIDEHAVDEHLRDGDYLGACVVSNAREMNAIAIDNNKLLSTQQQKMMSVSAGSIIKLSPVPNKGVFNVQLENYKAGAAEIRITDVNNKTIATKKVSLTGKTDVFNFRLSNAVPGIYYVTVINSTGVQSRQMMLQR